MSICLSNRHARRLFLHKHGLADPPIGPGKGGDLLGVIRQLGFVQVDSINTVARAHDMILFARRSSYRPKALKQLLERDGHLFEHWTHDASVIPTEFFPHWRTLRFERDAKDLPQRWRSWQRGDFEAQLDAVLNHLDRRGPSGSADVGQDEKRSNGGWWEWHPSKTALEYLWRSGQISVLRRDGFQKVYDRTERVHPIVAEIPAPDPAETLNWAFSGALDRIGFGTSGDIGAFWASDLARAAKRWSNAEAAKGRLVEINVENADGSVRKSFARPNLLDSISEIPEPPNRLRILSPFDPTLRDRNRAERLFGFHYRIEIFVPAAKRKYGYYVFPMLEGDDIVGRIDMKAHRDMDQLRVTAVWPERGVKWGKGRQQRLEAELNRIKRLAGVGHVVFEDGWLRDPY